MAFDKYAALRKVFGRWPFACGLCFIGGALAALSMAPFYAWYILPVSFGVLYCALCFAENKKHAFSYGWVFGFGYFVFSLSWIGNALLVDGNPYAWAWPLAVCALPAALSFFTGFAALCSRIFLDFRTFRGLLGFTGLFSFFEWLRGTLFTGFPWNLFGYSWGNWPAMYQILYPFDVYVLSLLSVFWAAAFGYCMVGRRPFAALGVVILSFGAVFGYGSFRLSHTPVTFHEDVQLKIVQPNIAQADKWERAQMEAHFEKHIQLSRAQERDAQATTYIIWPETALSPFTNQNPYAMDHIREMLFEYKAGAHLFSGDLRYDSETQTYTNALIRMEQDGRIQDIYNKSHLVPFGEYIPFQDYIPLTPIVQFTGFEAGNGPVTSITPEGLTYSPLICYEILFPYNVIQHDARPDFIVNVTNDAWYGDSAGPRQHLDKALYRAVENGIPVVRSANTGISALISPVGTYVHRSEIFQSGFIVENLPEKLLPPPFNPLEKKGVFIVLCLIFYTLGTLKKSFNTNHD